MLSVCVWAFYAETTRHNAQIGMCDARARIDAARAEEEDPPVEYHSDVPRQRYAHRVNDGQVTNPKILPSRVRELRASFVPWHDDIFIATFPRCGTTWTQQIVLLLLNGGDPTGLNLSMCGEHTPWVEQVVSSREPGRDRAWLDNMPSSRRRVLKTHASVPNFPCVPDGARLYSTPTARTVFVTRNPKDACVSNFHHARDKPVFDFSEGRWEDFFELFMSGRTESGDFWQFTTEWAAAAAADPERVLCMRYEQLATDPAAAIATIARHLGVEPEPGLIDRVVKASGIEAMRAQHAERMQPNHLRKGGVGGWRSVLTEAEAGRIDARCAQALQGCAGLRFEFG